MLGHRTYSAWQLHPLLLLTVIFLAWKILLYLVVANSPGPGYDTSTTLLFPSLVASDEQQTQCGLLGLFWRFIRWDSIYYVRIAERGYLYEQEWAFGFGYTRLLSYLSDLSGLVEALEPKNVAVAGIALSHLAHYLSAIMLYALSALVFETGSERQKSWPFVSAILHIISPAGAFLSAPCGESTFAFLNFAAYFVYLAGLNDHFSKRCFQRDFKFLLAGVLFAAATTIRSNGILGGMLFAFDACQVIHEIFSYGVSWNRVRYLGVIGLGGSVTALGTIGPQYVAYQQFCVPLASPTPLWCEKTVPSVYSWVQSRYWNVGFMRYWTVSNIPLFLLAAPMLYLLCQSSLFFINTHKASSGESWFAGQSALSSTKPSFIHSSLIRLAVPQAVLAFAALTSYHVQIINRLASGYPVWYWYLASLAESEANRNRKHRFPGSHRGTFSLVTQAIVLYGLIQGVLFGSFLPPA